MNKKRKAKVSDLILKCFIDLDNVGLSCEDISKELNIEYDIINTIADKLIYDKYLENVADVKISKFKNEKIVALLPKGRYFLNQEGGSISSHNKYIKRQIWVIAKIITAILNATAILLLAYWNISEIRKYDNLEKILIDRDSMIFELNEKLNKLDTLKMNDY